MSHRWRWWNSRCHGSAYSRRRRSCSRRSPGIPRRRRRGRARPRRCGSRAERSRPPSSWITARSEHSLTPTTLRIDRFGLAGHVDAEQGGTGDDVVVGDDEAVIGDDDTAADTSRVPLLAYFGVDERALGGDLDHRLLRPGRCRSRRPRPSSVVVVIPIVVGARSGVPSTESSASPPPHAGECETPIVTIASDTPHGTSSVRRSVSNVLRTFDRKDTDESPGALVQRGTPATPHEWYDAIFGPAGRPIRARSNSKPADSISAGIGRVMWHPPASRVHTGSIRCCQRPHRLVGRFAVLGEQQPAARASALDASGRGRPPSRRSCTACR